MSNGPPTYRKTGKDLAVLKLPGNATAKFSNVFKPVFGIFFYNNMSKTFISIYELNFFDLMTTCLFRLPSIKRVCCMFLSTCQF